ncbi:MAG: HAD family hydrolase [Phycisphaerae bacterium]
MNGHGVIFDMDGVLVDSYQAHYKSWKQVGEKHGLTMTEEQFADTFGQTSRDIIRNLWGDAIPDEEIPEVDREKEAAYRQIIAGDFPEMDGADDLLKALAEAGFLIAIGSSGPPENIQVAIDCLPHGRVVSATVTGEDVTNGKPDPEVFLTAAKKLGLEPAQCAVVEDAPAGVEAARRGSMAALAITGTARREELSDRAHIVVDSLRELDPDKIRSLIDRHAG